MLEELNHSDFNIIKPETPDIITTKGSVEEMIFREEVNNWLVRKKKYNTNIHNAYALILVQCTEGLKNKLQVRKYWETHTKNQLIGILISIK